MKTIQRNASDAEIFGRMMKTAQHGTFDGLVQDGGTLPPYLDECRWWIERWDCLAILTRDVGYYTSGWWKNPDYERCYHLSVSFPGGFRRKAVEPRGEVYTREFTEAGWKSFSEIHQL